MLRPTATTTKTQQQGRMKTTPKKNSYSTSRKRSGAREVKLSETIHRKTSIFYFKIKKKETLILK